MATKKEIKAVLKELNLTEDEMDKFWNELIGFNKIVTNLSKNGMTWRDLHDTVIKKLPTQKERDEEQAEESRLKAEQEVS